MARRNCQWDDQGDGTSKCATCGDYRINADPDDYPTNTTAADPETVTISRELIDRTIDTVENPKAYHHRVDLADELRAALQQREGENT